MSDPFDLHDKLKAQGMNDMTIGETVDLVADLRARLAAAEAERDAAIRAAVAAETERCAAIASATAAGKSLEDAEAWAALEIARAIREAPPPQETQT